MADDKHPEAPRGYGGSIGYGQGYGRDFGGGRNQGFDGSWGQGYGGSARPSDERSWIEARAENQAEGPSADDGPHRGRGPQGWTRSDERLHEQVCEALSQDPMLDARHIEVEVAEGVVTLSGSVPEATDVALAGLIARRCGGVSRIDNRIEAAPDPGQPDYSPPGSDHMQTSGERWAEYARTRKDG